MIVSFASGICVLAGLCFFRAYRPIGFFGEGMVDYFGEGMVVFWGDVAVVLIILCTFVAKLQI